MRILHLSHACGPNRGSEPGTAWNLAWELSANHEVHVITHPQHQQEIDAYLVANPRPNLKFVYVNVDSKWNTWDPKRGEKGLKVHYVLWQKVAARKAQEMCAAMKFDVAHHVSLGTINAPPVMHGLPVPVIWGPIGGGQTTPMQFKQYFKGSVMRERLRHVMAAMLPWTPSLKRMTRKSSIILAKNHETLELLNRAGAKRAMFFLDCGLAANFAPNANATREARDTLHLLWAGRLELRKTLLIGLEAIARTNAKVKLTVAGDGDIKPLLQEQARSLGIDEKVDFIGSVPYATMSKLFRESDALLFTSLRDSSGCVVLEAMAYGLPVIQLNHQGVKCFVPDEAAVKIRVDSPEQVIDDLARGMEHLAVDPGRRERMGIAALEASKLHRWPEKATEIEKWYQEAAAQPG